MHAHNLDVWDGRSLSVVPRDTLTFGSFRGSRSLRNKRLVAHGSQRQLSGDETDSNLMQRKFLQTQIPFQISAGQHGGRHPCCLPLERWRGGALPTRCVPLDIRENRVRLVVITHNDFL